MAGKTKSLGPAAFDTEIDIRGAVWRADENRRKQYDAVLASANFAGIFRFACANYLEEVNPAFFLPALVWPASHDAPSVSYRRAVSWLNRYDLSACR